MAITWNTPRIMAENAIGSAADSVANQAAGMVNGAVNSVTGGLFGASGGMMSKMIDHRARVRPKSSAERYVYGSPDKSNILYPLYQMGGLVWPYTPHINIQQNVNYSSYSGTHTNQDFQAYKNTPSFQFSCSGTFTAQNEQEKAYCLACLHFLRTTTKMHFGANDDKRGTPPPVLLFSAYGNLMFNDLPVVITSYSLEFQNDADYVKYETLVGNTRSKGVAWLPAKFQISVNMTVQKSPSEMRNDFDLNKFRTGQLLVTKRGGWF